MHINPDGDCVGSALALSKFLTNMGKTAHVFLEPNNPLRYGLESLPLVETINANELKTYDLSVAVDCADSSRLGTSSLDKFIRAKEHFMIDHHASGVPFTEEYIIEPKSASCTEVLYKIFKEAGKKYIDKDIATLIFAGLISDSGSLSFSSTTKESYLTCAELCDYGIDRISIIRSVFSETTKNAFTLKMRIANRAEFYEDGRIGLLSFFEKDFKETSTTQSDTDGAINLVANIKGVSVALSLAELNPNAFKVGIRTKNGVDAGKIAGYFGGGGHFSASGCRIYSDYETAVKKLLEATRKCLTDL